MPDKVVLSTFREDKSIRHVKKKIGSLNRVKKHIDSTTQTNLYWDKNIDSMQ